MTKYCKDCKFYRPFLYHVHERTCYKGTPAVGCAHKNNESMLDLVLKEMTYIYTAQQMRYDNIGCGEEGKWFEQLPAQVLIRKDYGPTHPSAGKAIQQVPQIPLTKLKLRNTRVEDLG